MVTLSALTDKQIDQIANTHHDDRLCTAGSLRRFARAILAASPPSTPANPPSGAREGWQPIEIAPKNMSPRLYLIGRYCVQGFVDATGELMAQSEISPHWRKMRGKPSHWMPLPDRAHMPQSATGSDAS